ncbi:disintegrin and metalloproteinase domain-containing protein 9 isoform X3 [Eublepharis macularius]|uniref:Disintegrin and metalloproteinase domain-containing protein 9 isoform X3 n=1 Tax=Eublepharis macularius TaxID=481883 RepID=A0AA97LFV2_EUBMA|nr:disintegrin and metalloproteinase domain-containing protein 9 isoform X3 [Eublepharis macularius]
MAGAASSAFLLLLFGALSLQADRPGFQQLSHLSSYDIIVPQRVTRERREASGTSLAQDKLSYVVEVEGRKRIIHLQRNKGLLPKDFTVYTYKEDGTLHSEIPDVQGHCHYQGYIEGISDSVVAVSTCFGLRGLLQVENITYGIEPMELPSGFQHIIYRMENVKKEPMACGVADPGQKWEWMDNLHPLKETQLLRRKRGVLLQTRYVELIIVVDKERYVLLGKNETAVREEMVQLANYLDVMYSILNIRVVLVGLEIWTKANKISIDGGAGDVLSNFVQWRERDLVSRRRHDSAQLVLIKPFGGTAGMAYVGTVCSKSLAGGINVFGQMSVQMFASIVAHELGHNLGMNHDDERACTCETKNCIMNSGASGSMNFSSCSAEDFEKLTLNKGGSCLLNIPRPEETYSPPYCGNKLVDAGEDCDCGSPEECKSDPCCEAGTCKLRSGADCAYGDCCLNCHYLSQGTVCRESANECDLPEYCNGTSPFCPQDTTIQNGHPCHNNEAYCYNGMCQYYDAQCKAIFGSKAKAAPEVCFSEVNSKGDRFGNCGYHGYEYKKCSSRNAMCGKLQCENVKTLPVFGIEPAIIQSTIKGSVCWGVDFQLGSDVPDPGMVNEGTKCAPGKICKHFECVDVAVLNYDCDVHSKCNGHGVCNSNKNCHCHPGWAPPYCDSKGYGGSLDSGPPYNESALHFALNANNKANPSPKTLRYRRSYQNQQKTENTYPQQQTENTYPQQNTYPPQHIDDSYSGYEYGQGMDNTTKNWLLAFFFVVVPILLVLLFCHLTKDSWVHSLLPLVDHCRCWGGPVEVTSPDPVHTEFPPSVPHSTRHPSGQMPMEQHTVPQRPPPPVLKKTPQEHFYPSRPAPLPPI